MAEQRDGTVAGETYRALAELSSNGWEINLKQVGGTTRVKIRNNHRTYEAYGASLNEAVYWAVRHAYQTEVPIDNLDTMISMIVTDGRARP